jgi:hypothetical protein
VDELSGYGAGDDEVPMPLPEMIKGTIQVFVNSEGFTLGVQAEAPPRGSAKGSGGPPPPPSHHDDEDDDSD